MKIRSLWVDLICPTEHSCAAVCAAIRKARMTEVCSGERGIFARKREVLGYLFLWGERWGWRTGRPEPLQSQGNDVFFWARSHGL